MSLDLFVYGVEAVELGSVLSSFRQEEVRLVGDGDSSPASFVLERRLRGEFVFVASVDGPLVVESEDLPLAVVSRALGMGVVYQLSVEGGSRPAFDVARRFAQQLGSMSAGVVFDPQRDSVIWPRSSLRVFDSPRAESIDVLNFRWYVRREDMDGSIAQTMLGVIERHLPEAVPRRFGGYEPLQHKLEHAGVAGFVEQWRHENGRLFWNATKPCFGGDSAGLADQPIRPWLHEPQTPVGDISLGFDGRAFGDAAWRTSLEQLFTSMARQTGAFVAVADIDRNVGMSSARSLWYSQETEVSWPLAAGSEWLGLPEQRPTLLWLGDVYRDFLRSKSVQLSYSQDLVVRTPPPFETPNRHRWSLRRRTQTATNDVYSNITPEFRMTSTGRPLSGGTATRAKSIPIQLQ